MASEQLGKAPTGDREASGDIISCLQEPQCAGERADTKDAASWGGEPTKLGGVIQSWIICSGFGGRADSQGKPKDRANSRDRCQRGRLSRFDAYHKQKPDEQGCHWASWEIDRVIAELGVLYL